MLEALVGDPVLMQEQQQSDARGSVFCNSFNRHGSNSIPDMSHSHRSRQNNAVWDRELRCFCPKNPHDPAAGKVFQNQSLACLKMRSRGHNIVDQYHPLHWLGNANPLELAVKGLDTSLAASMRGLMGFTDGKRSENRHVGVRAGHKIEHGFEPTHQRAAPCFRS